jgi:hypothetical protein
LPNFIWSPSYSYSFNETENFLVSLRLIQSKMFSCTLTYF